MKKKYTFTVSDLSPMPRLDQLLFEWFQTQKNPLSKSFIRKLIHIGAIFINKKRVQIASKKPLMGQTIEAYVIAPTCSLSPTESPWIAYEDNWIIVVHKPALLPSTATIDNNREHLVHWLQKKLQTTAQKPYIGVHHRLDKDTSGLLLFSKNPSVNKAIASFFQNHLLKKTYLTLTHTSHPSLKPFTITNYLKNTAAKNKPQKWASVHTGGHFAQTHFTPLYVKNNIALLKAEPITGRTHQIRVHLSEAGLPLLGDPRYGLKKDTPLIPRTMLHAAALSFPHPVSQEPLCISAAVPFDFLACAQSFWKEKWPHALHDVLKIKK